jgi:hypothetical protein
MEEILRNQRKIIKYIEEDNNKWDIFKKIILCINEIIKRIKYKKKR